MRFLIIVTVAQMSHSIACYRCGASLAMLSLPFSRQDECPACHNYLHVCRMCVFFDPRVPRQCREDGADDVRDKDKLNFCDWYRPSDSAFDAASKQEEDAARAAAEDLFA
jgi:ribosomal protein L40E